jgi:hypothetical protein
MTPSYVVLKCPDGKNIVTSYNNLLSLSEFVDCFNIKVEACKIDDAQDVVNLEEIANIFCDSNYIKNNIAIPNDASELPENNMTKDKSSRYIRNKIKETILDKKEISFSQICKMFSNFNYSVPGLNNNFKLARQELESDGYNCVRLKRGMYRLEGRNDG